MNLAIQNLAREVDFRSSLAADSHSAAKYFETADAALESLGHRLREARTPERTPTTSRRARA